MAATTPDTSSRIEIYVRLLEEGTEVFRPTEALTLENGLFRVLATTDYDPENEKWEFPPESIVRCTTRQDRESTFLVAVKP